VCLTGGLRGGVARSAADSAKVAASMIRGSAAAAAKKHASQGWTGELPAGGRDRLLVAVRPVQQRFRDDVRQDRLCRIAEQDLARSETEGDNPECLETEGAKR